MFYSCFDFCKRQIKCSAVLYDHDGLLCGFYFYPDMTFTHEGNKTFTDNLVNFEKMVCMPYFKWETSLFISSRENFSTMISRVRESEGRTRSWQKQSVLCTVPGTSGFLENLTEVEKKLPTEPCIAKMFPRRGSSSNRKQSCQRQFLTASLGPSGDFNCCFFKPD